MSVLPAGANEALTSLLQGLQSTDNTIRTRAEEQLNTEWVGQQPGLLLMGLVEQIQHSHDEAVRQIGAL